VLVILSTTVLPSFFVVLGLVFSVLLLYHLHFSAIQGSVFTLCNNIDVSNLACSPNISLH
jgi:hypothetical protein